MSKLHRDIEELRTQSPRPETPEPDSRQGRRNPPEAGVQLLDDDGAISVQVRTPVQSRVCRACSAEGGVGCS